MYSCYKNTKKQIISSHLQEIYLTKDVCRDWVGGRIPVV